MTGALGLVAVGPFIALVGRVGAQLLHGSPGDASSESEGLAHASGLEAAVLRFLLGFGLVSLGLFGLVYFDCFTSWGLGIAAAVPVGLAFALCRRGPAKVALASFGRDLAVGLLVALLSLAFGWLQPAFDLTVAGSDASVYLAAAHQLAAEGRLRHHDALVAEMTADERKLLFVQTSQGRLPGGIQVLDGAAGRLTFAFYHLLPAWLALGLRTLGEGGDLRILSLFPVLSLCASFLIGRRLGGIELAVAWCVVQSCFLPQAYFSRFPSSEILAQALFLAGLAFLVVRLGAGVPVRLQDAAAAGALWGALCLSRVDSIPFLCIGLTLAAFGCRRAGLGANAWLVVTAWVVACASLAIHHQFANGSYLYLPAMGILRGALATAVPGLVTEAWGRIVVLAIAVTIVAASHRSARAGVERRSLFQVVRTLGAVAALAVLAAFISKWHWVAVARHVAWMTWYATPGGLAVLTAGLVFGSLRWLRAAAEPGARLGLALLVGPAFCYLVNPLVTRTQPWGVRRFIPMVFPLFLLLSLLGCRALLIRLTRGRARLAAVTYGGLVVGIAATFYSLSARVVLPGAVMPVREQLGQLVQMIPERALVLAHEQDAWLHVQTALQYVLRRETLLLPLASGSDPRDDLIVSSYLGRQLAKGRRLVLLLAQDETRAGSLLRSYALRSRGSGSLEYVILPYERRERFPPRMRLGRMRYRVYEIRSVAHAPGWREILIGDVEQDAAVVMEGFHAAETSAGRETGGQPFRWTGPLARLALPPVEEVRIVLDTWRPPSAPAAQVEIDIDGVPLGRISDTHQGRQCLRLRLPREPVAVKRIVTLRTNTFEVRAPRRPAQTRELGVRVFSVSIDGPGASAATDVHDESCASPLEPLPARHVSDGAGPGLDRAGERTKTFR